MAADASIYGNLLARPKSVFEYSNEFAARDDAEQNRQMNALRMQGVQADMAEKVRARQEQEAFRNLLASGGIDTSTPEGQRRLTSVAPTLAGSYIKQQTDNAKTAAEVKDRESQATEREFNMKRKQNEDILNAVSFAKDQQSYTQAVQFLKARGYDLSAIPEQYDPRIVAGFGQMAQTALQRLEQEQKAREFNLKANNELIGPDGKINPQVLGAKQSISKAGASTVSINTGQKGLDNEFKLRGEFKSEPVYKAHQEMQSAYGQIKQAIDQQSPAGDLAAATKIMKLLDPGSVVRESELGMAMQASGLIDRASNFVPNILSGKKLTPQQRTDFRALADALYSTSVNQYNAKRGEYEKLGGEYQLNAPRALGPSVPSPDQQGAPAGHIDSLVNKYRSSK